MRIPLSDLFPSRSLLVLDTRTSPPNPLPVRLGDANLDGYPDILLITASARGGTSEQADRKPQLVFSVSCGKGVPGCDSRGKGYRGLQVAKSGVDTLTNIQDATGMAFLDIDEDV